MIIIKLGDGGYWFAMGFVLIAWHGSDAYPAAMLIALTTVAGVCIYKGLKNKLVRQRPYVTHSGIELGTKPLDEYSFPSGHTMHAVALTIMFTHAEPMLLIAALPFALLVAASRVVLGLHYPSDVIAGAAIGGSLAVGAIALGG